MPGEVELYVPDLRLWWHSFETVCKGVEITIVLGQSEDPPHVVRRKTITPWSPCLICQGEHVLTYKGSTDHDPDEDEDLLDDDDDF